MIRQTGKHVGEPGLRIDVVELGGLDERVDGGGAPAAFVGSGEGPVAASDRNVPVILPISDRRPRSFIAGIRFTGVVSGALAANSASLAALSMSR